MTDQEFSELKKRVSSPSFLKIDDSTAVSFTATLPNKYQTFLDILTSESYLLKSLMNKRDKMYADLYIELKEKHRRTIENKTEYEAYINHNEDYYKILVDISKQETIVNYLEQTINNIKQAGYAVKNYIDLKRFYSGS